MSSLLPCSWVYRLSHAGQRPLNSALELDLDFERTMAPPPAPTEEGTASLEETIRRAAAKPSENHRSMQHVSLAQPAS